ncbi:MAG TPA: hypothetical protein VG456_08765 [Candidatus Sulfopaludibacter sp.]|jgi:hypothetical protein|nr:hypothetical protein [Candidatus Sulfopaludibacter sp.]
MKTFLTVTALALASLSMAAAGTKSYEIVLNSATQAGKTQLRAGHYTVKQSGEFAQFFNIDNGRTVMVPMTVQAFKCKFDNTSVDTSNENGVSQLESIDLQDTNIKLAF